MTSGKLVLAFEEVGRDDVALVGGKNASLGEMVNVLTGQGIAVPPGFATTAKAYRRFVAANGLDRVIDEALAAQAQGAASLAETGATIRKAFRAGRWPDEIAEAIVEAYRDLSARLGAEEASVAVRSSATAEDLPEASFAGQQETFLNVAGADALLEAARGCYASLYTDRAITYREAHGFAHRDVALSVGVQQMVRADTGGAGVMFSIDTETGFDRAVTIDAAWGLGETVVQGLVDPDEYQVFKPLLETERLKPIIARRRGAKEKKLIYGTAGDAATRMVATSRAEREALVLSDADVLQLARWACAIEAHYGRAMDMEWARDGETGALFIVQARPETVESRKGSEALRSYAVTSRGPVLARGLAIGSAAVTGRACLIEHPSDMDRFVDGAILVTGSTDPDWVPVMRRAAAIVTDHGGRTSHAAIVSRELGVPAVIGTAEATRVLHDEQAVTVSCAEGDEGFVYDGLAEIAVSETDLSALPATRTGVMLNLANPAAALRWWRLPADGIGLVRMEFVINNAIKVHPMALVEYDRLPESEAKREIAELTRGYDDRAEYFVDRLALGLARIAAAHYPKPVIVRTSDFKSNEYARLIGGAAFERPEANPMLGFRGAARYVSERYRAAFALECRALKRLREEIGLDNIIVMIPFCRSLGEADKVLEAMAENGLARGRDGLEVYVMCEVPSNVVLAEGFAERFDGFSIGSNDLTQLTLGVDRDAEDLAALFDEQDAAVKWMIRSVIAEAHRCGARIGLCGQAPSDHPEFAAFLVECGIDSISVSPDSFVAVKQAVATAEAGETGSQSAAALAS